jgi:hypothetical protein
MTTPPVGFTVVKSGTSYTTYRAVIDDPTAIIFSDSFCDVSGEQFFACLGDPANNTVDQLIDVLRTVPYEAYFWECAPVLQGSTAPFEFTIVDDVVGCFAGMRPDRLAFSEHFHKNTNNVVDFANLSGDARLVVPCPLLDDAEQRMLHVGSFVRGSVADDEYIQARNLFRRVGQLATARLAQNTPKRRPLWVSTSGLGIPWLHVRLSDTPKYYRHTPYTRCP